MNGSARDKIFKSWKGISEVALIKEVATKGEHVDLCIEYCARKRKMQIKDYRLFFHDVVQNYVQRLLTERLVCKAENVLRNVQRDVRCCYYQFACECDDEELREVVLEHIHSKDVHGLTPDDDNVDMQELHFNWELLQHLKEQPELLAKCKANMPDRRINLEAMVSMDAGFRRRILVELYFASHNVALLPQLNKYTVWEYLVETHQDDEIVRWCTAENISATSVAENHYSLWLPVEAEMYEHALKTLSEPTEVLRDCFARAGYFFADERADVTKLLGRISSTSSFDINRELLEKLPMAHYLFDRKQYMLMLRSFVVSRELEELAEEHQEERKLLELIVALKNNNLQEREGFEKTFYAVKLYLEGVEQERSEDLAHIHTVDEPLVAFYEFLCYEPTISSLNCFLRSSALQRIPYLDALSDRFESGTNVVTTQSNTTDMPVSSMCKYLPTAYELLRKFKHIDFKHINRESLNEVASFSNERLCQRYARRYQLNFLHHLKQHRSAYAVYYLLTSYLQSYAQLTGSQLFSACETVTEFALQHVDNSELLAHCIAFIEMLGFDSQPLRTLLKLRRFLEDNSTIDGESACITNYKNLIEQVELHLLPKLSFADDQNDNSSSNAFFPLAEYQALMRLVNCNQFSQWPIMVLQHYASHNDWWRLLVLLQYFELPLDGIRNLVTSFETRQIGEHLLRALSYEAPPMLAHERGNTVAPGSVLLNKRHSGTGTRPRKSTIEVFPQMTTSVETMTSSVSSCNDASANGGVLSIRTLDQIQQLRFLDCVDEGLLSKAESSCVKFDLFAIVLLSATSVPEDSVICVSKFLESMQNAQSQQSTSWNLLQHAVKYHLPVLAILASTVNETNVNWHWLVWLAVATDQWTDLLNFAVQVKEKPCDLSWHIIETATRQGYVSTIYRSICIFFGSQYPLGNFFRFLHLTQNSREFGEKAMHELSLYLLAWSNDEVRIPLDNDRHPNQVTRRDQLLQHTMQLLLIHLQQNFDSILEQQRFLACICRSGMTDLCGGQIDFCLLNEVFCILQDLAIKKQQEKFQLNFERLLQQRQNQEEYKILLAAFLEARAYDAAIRLANLLHMPIGDIVYAKWIDSLNLMTSDDDNEENIIDFAAYEAEVVEHALPPELLVNFFLHAASIQDETTGARRKYIFLHHALNVIKKHLLFPNESFDRDQIEYNMIICYLQLDESVAANLSIYHSEYYEQIMLQERCVLYKSFLELKELAGIDELSGGSLKTPLTDVMQQRLEALLHRLLDENDIVEALRLQELFDCRPLNLRFIVFCMALAEGVTTIFSMSSEERQLLRDVEKSAFAKFNKRTLDTTRASSSQGNHQSYSSSPMRDEFSDSCSTLEFEEIPSKEKRETLETIQCIASKLKHGINLGKRIVMAYRAAMYLDKEYLDVLRTKDSNILLRSVAEEGCLHRLLVVSDIMISTQMTADEIADLLAFEITTAVVRPRFYIFSAGQQVNSFKNADLWGYNIDRDLHLFLELTPNTTKLGNRLLEYCDALKAYRKFQDNKPYKHTAIFEKLAEIIRIYGLPTTHTAASGTSMATTMATKTNATPLSTLGAVGTSIIGNVANTVSVSPSNGTSAPHPTQVLSHKKQNLIYVELLIKAHQCFVHECSMEGIANVLYRTKALNTILTQAKSWSLIVRMLIGIGRYREMFYCFDSLVENEQFESLLGQFDEEKTIGLRQAILAYLRENGPENSREFLKLAALHFLMYKDLAEIWEQDAQMILAKVINTASIPRITTSGSGGGNAMGSNSEQTSILRLRCTAEVHSLLQQALQNYMHATENYLLDNKLLLAQKTAAMAEVIAMQIDLVNKSGGVALTTDANGPTTGTVFAANCVCVLNVQTRDEFRELVNAELSVPQVLILSRGYGYDINWTEALLSQYILLMRKKYLSDFLSLIPINDGIIENVVKGFQRYMQNHNKTMPLMEEHLAHLVTLVRSVTLRYKLASLLSMKTFVMSVINDQTVHYLKDTSYGRNENHNMPDI